jgi:hypothetical protein
MQEKTVSKYDEKRGALEIEKNGGEVAFAKPSTIRNVEPVKGWVEMFIVETARHLKNGDTIFLECVDDDERTKVRIALPPKVAEAIARQREIVALKCVALKRRQASERAKARMAAGWVPGFLRKKEGRA